MFYYLILWSQYLTQSYPSTVRSPQFQTFQIRTRHWSEQRLSCTHRTPETKLSDKIPYNYTTVKPQLGALAKHFLLYGYFGILLYEIQSSDSFSYTEGHPQSLPFGSVSLVNVKWLLPFVMLPFLTAFTIPLRRDCKSPDILQISDGSNSLKLILCLAVSNCFVSLWRWIFLLKTGSFQT